MVGDFCNFVRRTALNDHKIILNKYEKILVSDLEVFKGFCEDEFERIRVWNTFSIHSDETYFDFKRSVKIFEYSNFKIRYEDLTVEQRKIFTTALDKHIERHSEDIELLKKLEAY